MISDTYTNLSHDIRTPLTSLDGYFQLLEESEDAEEQKHYMDIIQDRIHSLKEMLEELFLFTKLKNESYHLELKRCCVNQVLKQTIFSYYDEWTTKGIEPDIHITDKLLYIDGNETALQSVFQNVIKNALDHGANGIGIDLEERNGKSLIQRRCLNDFIRRIQQGARIPAASDFLLQRNLLRGCMGKFLLNLRVIFSALEYVLNNDTDL